MSFYASPNHIGVFPGIITANNSLGVCERVCIEVKKVFDACLNQSQVPDLNIVVTDLLPANPTLPLTFVSAISNSLPATISNVDVVRFDDQPNFARVRADVTVPLTINYLDANGGAGSGATTITVSEDVVLYVPQPSIVPFEITCFANCVCSSGTYTGDYTFNVTACLSVILKVIAEVDILVPSYGYCPIPPCTPYEADTCHTFFNLPLYPTAVSPPNNNQSV